MDIPFESFAELVDRLGHPPLSHKRGADTRRLPIAPDKIFASWLNHLPRPFVPGTGKRLFRLLFPHEGNRRRYGLKETRLAAELEGILGIEGLRTWDAVRYDGVGGEGCLGHVLEHAMRQRLSSVACSGITLSEVDTLLDALAAPSAFSQLSQLPHGLPSPEVVLTRLFRDAGLSAWALAVLAQVLLRDLRPLLCPLPAMPVRHPTSLLRVKTTQAPAQLGLHMAMWCWDPTMARLYRDGKGCVDLCADAAEAVATAGNAVVPIIPGPVLGVNVQIPKCLKGRSVGDALHTFTRSERECTTLWAETKYDGYRMQIDVEVKDGVPAITVFSKSKRRSTLERRNAHAIILAALGIPIPSEYDVHPALRSRLSRHPHPDATPVSSVILEAEVIPYNEGGREGGRGPGVEEFWWLQSAGVTVDDSERHPATSQRHLCLAFFDIVHLNGRNLLASTYRERRRSLESVVKPIEGFSFVAKRSEISLRHGIEHAERLLGAAFERCVKRREEGLVLKADESVYNDTRLRWVKLKKDYIPDLGDCVDLVVLGAGWDIDRARELRVDTSVFTTFYIGTLSNRDTVFSHRHVPHFEILFRVSYGLSRDQLELYNENLRLRRWRTKPFDKDDPWKRRLVGLSWLYSMPKSMPPPSVLLEQPLCAEVMGAGFQRLPFSRLYELRWPRMIKIFDKAERPWTDALTAQGLVEVAHRTLGYLPSTEPPSSPEDDSVRALWRSRSTAVVDIPDTSPTPTKRVPSTPTRRASAPMVLKQSPPTPVHAAPPTSPLATRRPLESAKRLTAAFGGCLPSPPRTSSRLLFSDERPTKRPRTETALPSPPPTSPCPHVTETPRRKVLDAGAVAFPLSLRSRFRLAKYRLRAARARA